VWLCSPGWLIFRCSCDTLTHSPVGRGHLPSTHHWYKFISSCHCHDSISPTFGLVNVGLGAHWLVDHFFSLRGLLMTSTYLDPQSLGLSTSSVEFSIIGPGERPWKGTPTRNILKPTRSTSWIWKPPLKLIVGYGWSLRLLLGRAIWCHVFGTCQETLGGLPQIPVPHTVRRTWGYVLLRCHGSCLGCTGAVIRSLPMKIIKHLPAVLGLTMDKKTTCSPSSPLSHLLNWFDNLMPIKWRQTYVKELEWIEWSDKLHGFPPYDRKGHGFNVQPKNAELFQNDSDNYIQ